MRNEFNGITLCDL